MKKKFIFISAVAILSILIGFEKFHLIAYAQSIFNNPDLSFAVISDIHTNKGKLDNAINDLHDNVNPRMDALVFNGDTVDEGREDEYKDITDILTKNSDKLPANLIKNIGNHEYFNFTKSTDKQKDLNKRMNRYFKFSGRDKVYDDTWINGYHFISLGSDNIAIDKSSITKACITIEQINWFKNAISEGYEEGKPIFVFFHEPVYEVLYGDCKEKADGVNKIKYILKDYPEAVLFTSHTHYTPNDNYDEQKGITIINTGSVNSNYVVDAESGDRKEDNTYSNGIYVEVNGNTVVIKARDFTNKQWIYTRTIS